MNGFIIFTMSYDTNVTFYHFMIKFVRSGKQGDSPFVLGILIAVVRKPGKVRACEEKRCVVANVKVAVCVCGGARGI